MKASINCKEREFEEGTKFIEVVRLIREAKKDEPMIKTIKERRNKKRPAKKQNRVKTIYARLNPVTFLKLSETR